MKLAQTGQFRKDVKRQIKRGKEMAKLKRVIDTLLSGDPLEAKQRDHPLAGSFASWRECHIEPDWLLVYRIEEETLFLGRTGSHSDLF